MGCRFLALGLLVSASLFAGDGRSASAGVVLKESRVDTGGRMIRVTLVVFPSRHFKVLVVDNGREDGAARYASLSAAMVATGCVAGCNGGFFTRQPFAPVGGMTSGSRMIQPVDHGSWMKGLLVVRSGIPDLITTDAIQDTPETTDLLQSGTWLVRNGRSETDNSRPQQARRTFVCHDGAGLWALGVTDPCSLHELAALLRSNEIISLLDIQSALNLDGGPSTGLWVKGPSSDFYFAERWPVRNFIGIALRESP